MLIFPIHAEGSVPRYHSNAVYTTGPDGSRLLVGVDYEAGSIAEVIRLAVLNAKVRGLRANLRDRMSLRSRSKSVRVECRCGE